MSAVPRYPQLSESEYVFVRRFSGRYTHSLCHQLSSYLPPGYLGMLTERELDALE